MYIAAQRVRSSTGQVGINAFLHRHADGGPIDWTNPDIALIVTGFPGELVDMSVTVKPGGNRVVSILDLAASERFGHAKIKSLLTEFGKRLGSNSEMETSGDGYAMRFLYGDPASCLPTPHDEFRDLSSAAMRLYSNLERRRPIVFELSTSERGMSIRLTQESVPRVEGAGGMAATISVDHNTKFHLEQQHGPMLLHMVSAATNLSQEKLLTLGGVRIVDSAGRECLRWPVD